MIFSFICLVSSNGYAAEIQSKVNGTLVAPKETSDSQEKKEESLPETGERNRSSLLLLSQGALLISFVGCIYLVKSNRRKQDGKN